MEGVRLGAVAVAVGLVLGACGSSRVNKDPGSHAKTVEQSRIQKHLVVSMDTVYSAGQAYALLEIGGVSTFAETYTFKSLTGVPCIQVMPYKAGDDGSSMHEYAFLEGTSKGMKGYLDFSFSTITVCENVLNNSLMNSTGLRPVDVGNFTKNNPRPPKFNAASLKVRRERAAAIEFRSSAKDGDIYQDGKKIGSYSYSTIQSENAMFQTIRYTVRFINGTEMAEVRIPFDKMERREKRLMEIETEYDGVLHAVDIHDDNTTWDVDAFKQAAKWLVDEGYL